MKRFIGEILRFFRLKKKEYYLEAFVYVDKNGNVVENEITDRIRWIYVFQVKAYSEKQSIKIGFDILNEKFPEYKDKIWIF